MPAARPVDRTAPGCAVTVAERVTGGDAEPGARGMSSLAALRRWTPLTFLFPGRYVDADERWAEFDLLDWSESEYEWRQDGWNGIRDVARPPAETVADGVGDCEDYALVAASWALANDRDGIGLAFCWDPPTPWPTHAIAFDEERVYSSGNTPEMTVDEWVEDSEYAFTLRRRIE